MCNNFFNNNRKITRFYIYPIIFNYRYLSTNNYKKRNKYFEINLQNNIDCRRQ